MEGFLETAGGVALALGAFLGFCSAAGTQSGIQPVKSLTHSEATARRVSYIVISLLYTGAAWAILS
jgi:hypothetical protein